MIVIPMAGMSSRFFKAGYKVPKYMLDINGHPVFDYSVQSFRKYFDSEKFLFIVKDIYDTPDFVANRIKKMGIKEYEIVCLANDTRGQAETVFLGIQRVESEPNESLTIFNIDTIRPHFEYPDFWQNGEGYLEVFRGSGDNWSFVKAENSHSNLVIETAEKVAISDLCSNGLYHFKSVKVFNESYHSFLNTPKTNWVNGELYIAPLYNQIIQKGDKVFYHLLNEEDIIFCGIPEEYETLKKNFSSILGAL